MTLPITASEYWTQIEVVAVDVTREAREYGGDIHDLLHAAIDGHEFVIYTAKAWAVCWHSSNEDALFEEGDGVAVDDVGSMANVMTRCAFHAMRADVMEHSAFDAEPEEEEGDDDDDEECSDCDGTGDKNHVEGSAPFVDCDACGWDRIK